MYDILCTVYLNCFGCFFSCAPPHFARISVVSSYMPASYPVCANLSVLVWCMFVCRPVCLVRVMWHGGHFCQIQHPGQCCDVKGTVKRQPPGNTGTAALSALFPLWHTHKQTHPCFLNADTQQWESPPRQKPQDCTVSSK